MGPERIDRLQIGCLIRRIQSENDAKQRREQECANDQRGRRQDGKLFDRRQIARLDRVHQQVPEDRRQKAPQYNADHTAKAGNHRRFDEELPNDVALARADRHADADLPRTLSNRYQHDIHNADAANQKRDPGNAAAEQRHHIGAGFGLLLHQAVGIRVEIPAALLTPALHELREQRVGQRLQIIAVRSHDDILLVRVAAHAHHTSLQGIRHDD